jgi:hypothetical protein
MGLVCPERFCVHIVSSYIVQSPFKRMLILTFLFGVVWSTTVFLKRLV